MKEIIEGRVKQIVRAVSFALAFSMIIPDASPVMAATYNEAAEEGIENTEVMAVEDELGIDLPTGDYLPVQDL
jgi:hypothetical protein